MYNWIRSILPERAAIIVTALIYAVMLILIIYFSFEQEANFNYLNL